DVQLIHDLWNEAVEAVPSPIPAPRVGIMLETPTALDEVAALSAMVDFVSIGTNDLTRHLVPDADDVLEPAVLRAVRAVRQAVGDGVRVSVCGEIAGDPVGAVAVVGLGIDELSAEPVAFAAVKRAVAAFSRAEAAELADLLADCQTSADARRVAERALATRGVAAD
ncbi:MAG TPA: putative PEP-binding protein, partial [Vicinamibacterales bacterium]|nr:putative PEP-binding protein [Vicinamibacterales bacterium]